jgi:hypothetical protein
MSVKTVQQFERERERRKCNSIHRNLCIYIYIYTDVVDSGTRRMLACTYEPSKPIFLAVGIPESSCSFSFLFQYFSRSDFSMYFYSVVSVFYCDLSVSLFFCSCTFLLYMYVRGGCDVLLVLLLRLFHMRFLNSVRVFVSTVSFLLSLLFYYSTISNNTHTQEKNLLQYI